MRRLKESSSAAPSVLFSGSRSKALCPKAELLLLLIFAARALSPNAQFWVPVVLNCNANEPKQQFKINKINNIDQYNNPITNTNNKNYKIQSDSLTKYGFYSVNPSIAYDQCLQLNNDGISVMPCTMNSSQRFTTNYHSVLE